MAYVMVVLCVFFGVGTERWALRWLLNKNVLPDHKN
jgi:hypothetical protein